MSTLERFRGFADVADDFGLMYQSDSGTRWLVYARPTEHCEYVYFFSDSPEDAVAQAEATINRWRSERRVL